MWRTHSHGLTLLLSACLLGAALSASVSPLGAQEAVPDKPRPGLDTQEPAPQAEGAAMKFWESFQGLRVNLSANLVSLGQPYSIAALRLTAGDSENPLSTMLGTEWQFVLDEALPLPEYLLKEIKDGTPQPDFQGNAPLTKDNWAFYWLESRCLELGNVTPLANFKKSAAEHKYVKFTQLMQHPKDYRGKVIPIRGQLLLLRQFPAPRPAQKLGIKFLYEGWIKEQARHNPYCVHVTELPEGLEPFEMAERKVKPEVTFHGYFIKILRFHAAKDDRLTPFLVGKTLEVNSISENPVEEQPFSRFVLFAVAGAVLALTVLAFAFSWWFRRGDDRVRARINALREKHGLDFQDIPPSNTESTLQPPAPLAPPLATEYRNGTSTEHTHPSPDEPGSTKR
jgi:hypothetical protein